MATISAQNPIASTEAITELVKKINEQFKQDELTEWTYTQFIQDVASGPSLEPGHLYKIALTTTNIATLPTNTAYVIYSAGNKRGTYPISAMAYDSSGNALAFGIPTTGSQVLDIIRNMDWTNTTMYIPLNEVQSALAGNGTLVAAPPVVH